MEILSKWTSHINIPALLDAVRGGCAVSGAPALLCAPTCNCSSSSSISSFVPVWNECTSCQVHAWVVQYLYMYHIQLTKSFNTAGAFLSPELHNTVTTNRKLCQRWFKNEILLDNSCTVFIRPKDQGELLYIRTRKWLNEENRLDHIKTCNVQLSICNLRHKRR